MASLTLNPNDDREEETAGIVEDKNDDDDDVPQLSANALAALQEFLQERQAQLEEEEEEAGTTAVTALQLDDQTQQQQQLRHVSEDWQLSQFWYVHVPCVYEQRVSCTWSFPKMFPLPDPCLHQVHRVNGYRVSERGVGSCG